VPHVQRFWSTAAGTVNMVARKGFLDFDGSKENNRTFTFSADLGTMYLART
jgi:hypothetical protein